MILGIWVHPWDLMDNGIENILEELEKHGFNYVSLAVRYVEERQAFPGQSLIYRNARRKTYLSYRDSIFWFPSSEYYRDIPENIRPKKPSWLDRDIVKEFRERIASYNLKPVYWLPTLRWDKIAGEYPEYCVRDIYGNIAGYKAQFLCPLNPNVRKLVLNVVEELSCRYEAYEIELDYIRYPEPVTHSPSLFIKLLQTPCFCDNCRRYYESIGVNVDKVKKDIVDIANTLLTSEDITGNTCNINDPECSTNLLLHSLYELINRIEVSKWLKARTGIITGLVEEIRDKTRQYGVKLSADLVPPSHSWFVGQDYEKLSQILDTIKIMLYTEPFHRSHKLIPYELSIAINKGVKEPVAGISIWPPSTPNTIKRDILLAKLLTKSFYAYSYGWAPIANIKAFIESSKMG